jgi:hypothetical protein
LQDLVLAFAGTGRHDGSFDMPKSADSSLCGW